MAEKEEELSSLINHFKRTALEDKSDSGKFIWKYGHDGHWAIPFYK